MFPEFLFDLYYKLLAKLLIIAIVDIYDYILVVSKTIFVLHKTPHHKYQSLYILVCCISGSCTDAEIPEYSIMCVATYGHGAQLSGTLHKCTALHTPNTCLRFLFYNTRVSLIFFHVCIYLLPHFNLIIHIEHVFHWGEVEKVFFFNSQPSR